RHDINVDFSHLHYNAVMMVCTKIQLGLNLCADWCLKCLKFLGCVSLAILPTRC
ncbi:hypothetical protein PV328_012067, partial [Microctonus aethiopoides]